MIDYILSKSLDMVNISVIITMFACLIMIWFIPQAQGPYVFKSNGKKQLYRNRT